MREKDPVLGIVTVKLAELFKNSSEVTRLFSLQEGVGEYNLDLSKSYFLYSHQDMDAQTSRSYSVRSRQTFREIC